jgi:FkbM family methyltransferase
MDSFSNWAKRKAATAIEWALPQTLKDRLIRHYSIPNVDWSLRNARDNGFQPDVIIDVGAYKGEWTRMAKRIFPESRVLAIEPQREKAKALEQVSTTHPNVEYEIALLDAQDGRELTFHLNETVSSVLPEVESDAPDSEQRSTITLDTLTDKWTSFRRPDLLKLDVQGYEFEILRGASRILDEHPPEIIQMEVSLIEINRGAPLFAEVTRFMDELDYRLYDLCSFMRRPLDDALWQVGPVASGRSVCAQYL